MRIELHPETDAEKKEHKAPVILENVFEYVLVGTRMESKVKHNKFTRTVGDGFVLIGLLGEAKERIRAQRHD